MTNMMNTETTLSSAALRAYGALFGRRDRSVMVAVDVTPKAIRALFASSMLLRSSAALIIPAEFSAS